MLKISTYDKTKECEAELLPLIATLLMIAKENDLPMFLSYCPAAQQDKGHLLMSEGFLPQDYSRVPGCHLAMVAFSKESIEGFRHGLAVATDSNLKPFKCHDDVPKQLEFVTEEIRKICMRIKVSFFFSICLSCDGKEHRSYGLVINPFIGTDEAMPPFFNAFKSLSVKGCKVAPMVLDLLNTFFPKPTVH